MEQKIKVALIGAGMIANEGHIPGYRAVEEKVILSAVCDRKLETAEKCAHRHKVPHFYQDVVEMLEKERPDLVSITAPNQAHSALTQLSLEHGANVLCEKPLSLDYAEGAKLYRLAKEKNLLLVSCQTQRFQSSYVYAREYIRDGLLGQPYYGEISRIRRRGIPTWGHFLDKKHNGGGALADIGVHTIDSILWLMGTPYVTGVLGNASSNIMHNETGIRYDLFESGALSGRTGSTLHDINRSDVEEFASGVILAKDCSINFKIAWAANLPNTTQLTILGEKMGLTVPNLHVYSTLGRDQADIIPRVFSLGRHDQKPFAGHYYLIENVVDALLGKTDLIVKPEETLNTIAVIDLFYRSVIQKGVALRSQLELQFPESK